MVLNKKQVSRLLVAALTGGTIIGESIGLYKLNQQVEQLNKLNTQLESKMQDLNNTIKKQNNTIDNMTKEIDNNKQTINDLQKENEILNQKLEAKKKEEASAKTSFADNPTSNKSTRASTDGVAVTMILTFYGDFSHENGGYAGIDAQGNKLVAGTVASNIYPFGTQFQLNGQIFTVRDRGGSNFNNSNRLDVFVPRQPGESDNDYSERIKQYGKQTVTMYKLS